MMALFIGMHASAELLGLATGNPLVSLPRSRSQPNRKGELFDRHGGSCGELQKLLVSFKEIPPNAAAEPEGLLSLD